MDDFFRTVVGLVFGQSHDTFVFMAWADLFFVPTVILAIGNLFVWKNSKMTNWVLVITPVMLMVGFYFSYRTAIAAPEGVDTARAVSHWEWIPPRMVWTYQR